MTQNENSLLFRQLLDLKVEVQKLNQTPLMRAKWIPKADVMEFLGFAPTQMSTITKKYNLQTTTIGKRKFYSVESLLKALDSEKR